MAISVMGAKSFDRVVRHRLVQVGIDRVRGQRAEQDRVAVGRRLGDVIRADVAARARFVLYNNGLAPHLGQLLRDEPTGDVERAARWKRHDEPDGLRRIGGRLRVRRKRSQPRGMQRAQATLETICNTLLTRNSPLLDGSNKF